MRHLYLHGLSEGDFDLALPGFKHSMTMKTVVGIDVGGKRKGFHAVVLSEGKFLDQKADQDPNVIFEWCIERNASVIGVDAPCLWSKGGSSRAAERELGQMGIHCYATPTRKRAGKKTFYNWVFNGETLYGRLKEKYALFDGTLREGLVCFETFPHAIVCALAGKVVSAKPKASVRRQALRENGYDDQGLPNIDFVDAALCAITADAVIKGRYRRYGDAAEGFIVVPVIKVNERARSRR